MERGSCRVERRAHSRELLLGGPVCLQSPSRTALGCRGAQSAELIIPPMELAFLVTLEMCVCVRACCVHASPFDFLFHFAPRSLDCCPAAQLTENLDGHQTCSVPAVPRLGNCACPSVTASCKTEDQMAWSDLAPLPMLRTRMENPRRMKHCSLGVYMATT